MSLTSEKPLAKIYIYFLGHFPFLYSVFYPAVFAITFERCDSPIVIAHCITALQSITKDTGRILNCLFPVNVEG